MNNSGIYIIRNVINNKLYIGSAVNFQERWERHIGSLLKNRHHSICLQRAWNKYSKNNFKFEILEEVEDKTKLIEREQYYLNTLLYASHNDKRFRKLGYNISRTAGSTLGTKRTEIQKIKMRRPKTEQARINISLVRKGKTWEEIYGIEGAQKKRIQMKEAWERKTDEEKLILINKRLEKIKGKPKSKETVEKIRKTLMGRKHRPETLEKYKNRKPTKEIIEKGVATRKRNGSYKPSKETIEKRKLTYRKTIESRGNLKRII